MELVLVYTGRTGGWHVATLDAANGLQIRFALAGDNLTQMAAMRDLSVAMQGEQGDVVAWIANQTGTDLLNAEAMFNSCFLNPEALLINADVVFECDAGVDLADVLVEVGEALAEALLAF